MHIQFIDDFPIQDIQVPIECAYFPAAGQVLGANVWLSQKWICCWPKWQPTSVVRCVSGAVHPAYHDIPLFLHCLTDQVVENVGSSFEIKTAMKL